MKSWASSLMSPPKLDSNLIVRRSGIAFLREAPPAWSNLLCHKPAPKLTVRLSCSRRSGCRKRGHTVVARKVETDQLATAHLAGSYHRAAFSTASRRVMRRALLAEMLLRSHSLARKTELDWPCQGPPWQRCKP